MEWHDVVYVKPPTISTFTLFVVHSAVHARIAVTLQRRIALSRPIRPSVPQVLMRRAALPIGILLSL